MDAAVVEFDALADPVRAAAEDHDLPAGRGDDLVLVAVGGVVVGRERLELGRTGVDQTVNGVDAGLLAMGAHGSKIGRQQVRELHVGVAGLLGAAQQAGVDGRERVPLQLLLHLAELAQLVQEPRIDLRQVIDLLHGIARPEGVADEKNALSVRRAEFLLDDLVLQLFVAAVFAAAAEAPRPRLERAQRLLERLLERAADGHGLADGLHR